MLPKYTHPFIKTQLLAQEPDTTDTKNTYQPPFHTLLFEIPFAVSRIIFQLRTQSLPLAPRLVHYGYLPPAFRNQCPICHKKETETTQHFLRTCAPLNNFSQHHFGLYKPPLPGLYELTDWYLTHTQPSQHKPNLFILYDRLVQRQRILQSRTYYTPKKLIKLPSLHTPPIIHKDFNPLPTPPPLATNTPTNIPRDANLASAGSPQGA